MITPLITLLICALVLYVIYYLVSLFISDATVLKIVGIILGLALLLYALRLFHFALP